MLKAALRFRLKQTFTFEIKIFGAVIQRRKSAFQAGRQQCRGSRPPRTAGCGKFSIAVEHALASKNNGARQTLLLHPFTNTQRDTLGKFEIVHDIREPGFKDVKRSAFVTFQQLAELYAKGVLEEFGFSVRMCPAEAWVAFKAALSTIK